MAEGNADDSDFEGFNSQDLPIANDIRILLEKVQNARDDDHDLSDFDDDFDDVDIYDNEFHNYQNDNEWSDNIHQINVEQFTKSHGPNHNLPFSATPLQFFELFLSPELFKHIVECTNNYAEIKASNPNAKWTKVTVDEMKAYFGIQILMGIHNLPQTPNYWSSDEALGVPLIKKTMPRERFDKISQYLHVSMSTDSNECDKLDKIRTVINHLSSAFQCMYNPDREISIDEGMCKYRGRVGFIQYLPMKPIKRGIKVWMAASPHNGYVHNFDIYTGKSASASGKGLSHDVVMKLVEPYFEKFHHVYFDNYFTSPRLLNELLQNGTFACGTIRTTRKGFPTSLKHKLKNIGDFEFRQSGNLLATIWRDKGSSTKPVSVLSTNSQPVMNMITRKSGRGQVNLSCPAPICAYNRYMGGVDLADQLRSYYPLGRSSWKWWTYLFWFLVNISIVNASILYTLAQLPLPRNAMSSLKFRLALAKNLIAGYCGYKRKFADRQNPLAIVHLRETNLQSHTCGRLPGRKKTCVYCREKNKQTLSGRSVETVFGCVVCNVNLCKDSCFANFHMERCGTEE